MIFSVASCICFSGQKLAADRPNSFVARNFFLLRFYGTKSSFTSRSPVCRNPVILCWHERKKIIGFNGWIFFQASVTTKPIFFSAFATVRPHWSGRDKYWHSSPLSSVFISIYDSRCSRSLARLIYSICCNDPKGNWPEERDVKYYTGLSLSLSLASFVPFSLSLRFF